MGRIWLRLFGNIARFLRDQLHQFDPRDPTHYLSVRVSRVKLYVAATLHTGRQLCNTSCVDG
jgi:hypothetical protein